eukprot:scaffold277595_cov31-Tisochrysis_lutea.AAC.3
MQAHPRGLPRSSTDKRILYTCTRERPERGGLGCGDADGLISPGAGLRAASVHRDGGSAREPSQLPVGGAAPGSNRQCLIATHLVAPDPQGDSVPSTACLIAQGGAGEGGVEKLATLFRNERYPDSGKIDYQM